MDILDRQDLGTGYCRGGGFWPPRRVGFGYGYLFAGGRNPWPEVPPVREAVGASSHAGCQTPIVLLADISALPDQICLTATDLELATGAG